MVHLRLRGMVSLSGELCQGAQWRSAGFALPKDGQSRGLKPAPLWFWNHYWRSLNFRVPALHHLPNTFLVQVPDSGAELRLAVVRFVPRNNHYRIPEMEKLCR